MNKFAGILVGACVIACAPAYADSNFDVGGFEGYALGSVAGQSSGPNVWMDDSSLQQPTPTVYEDAFTIASGHNKVLKVDPASLSTNDYSGAYLTFGQDLYAAGTHQVQISFDQFRGTLNQTAFLLEAPGPSRAASSYVGYEYGLDQSFYPTGNVSDFGLPLTAGVWQRVSLMIDLDKLEVTAALDGGAPLGPQAFELGVPPVKQFRGLGLRVYGTNRGTPNGPNYFDNVVVGNPVPEPGSAALLLTGLAALASGWRRRR